MLLTAILWFLCPGGPNWASVYLCCASYTASFLSIACPQGCLQCSRGDQCHVCDHGFFLKNGYCISSCVPGFPPQSSNDTCAGKLLPLWWAAVLPARFSQRLTSHKSDSCPIKCHLPIWMNSLVLWKNMGLVTGYGKLRNFSLCKLWKGNKNTICPLKFMTIR